MKAKTKGEERRHTTSTLKENCQPKFFRKVHVKLTQQTIAIDS
jgi:hypothetical protein